MADPPAAVCLPCAGIIRSPRPNLNPKRGGIAWREMTSHSGGQAGLDWRRGLVNKAFTARVVESMRSRVHDIVAGILDEVAERGEMDVVADLAYPIPVTVICDLFGVPQEDRKQVKEWSLDLIYTLDPLVA